MTSAAFASELLRRSARGYAAAALARFEQRQPGVAGRALPATFAAPAAEFELRILQLAAAVAVGEPVLFADAVGWHRTAFAHRDVPDSYLQGSVEALAEVLAAELPAAVLGLIEPYLAAARQVAFGPPPIPESTIEGDRPHLDACRRFLLATLEGRPDDALDLVAAQLDAGTSVADVHDHVLTAAQREVGRMWLLAESPIADEHLSSQVVGRALDLLQQRLPRPPQDAPHVLAFAVGGNMHDLGIRTVSQRLQLAGFRVTNLGGDMPASDLAWAVTDRRFDLIALSVTMLLQIPVAREVIAERDRALGGRPPVLVGGAPFALVPDLHRKIGADGSAFDGDSAVAAARRLVAAAR